MCMRSARLRENADSELNDICCCQVISCPESIIVLDRDAAFVIQNCISPILPAPRYHA